jgi:hypothetical protein
MRYALHAGRKRHLVVSPCADFFASELYGRSYSRYIVIYGGRRRVSYYRISLRYLAFEHHTRELVVNAIGRHLLGMARNGAFNKTPMVSYWRPSIQGIFPKMC